MRRLLVLWCWVLLTLQLPWHAGMAGGRALAATAGADGAALFCGGPLPPAVLSQLRAQGQLFAAADAPVLPQPAADTDLCELFAGLAAAAASAIVTVTAVPAAGATPALPSYRYLAVAVYTRPPARAPPFFA